MMFFKALIFLKIRVKPLFDNLTLLYGIFQVVFSCIIEYLDLQFTFEGIIFWYFIVPWIVILSIIVFINILGSNFILSKILKRKINLEDFLDYCDDNIPLNTNNNIVKGRVLIDEIISNYLSEVNKNTKVLNEIIGIEIEFFKKIGSILFYIYRKSEKLWK